MKLILLTFVAIAAAPINGKCFFKGCHDHDMKAPGRTVTNRMFHSNDNVNEIPPERENSENEAIDSEDSLEDFFRMIQEEENGNNKITHEPENIENAIIDSEDSLEDFFRMIQEEQENGNNKIPPKPENGENANIDSEDSLDDEDSTIDSYDSYIISPTARNLLPTAFPSENGENPFEDDLECEDDEDEDCDDDDNPCFSAMNMVEVYGKGTTTIDSVEIGDYVLTSYNKYSRVYSFYHKQKTQEATFVQIHTSSPWSPIEMSRNHLVFLDNQGMVRADTIKVGDKLSSYKVHDVKIIKRLGVYAPLTESGDLIVGDIFASSYVAAFDKSPLLSINQHTLAHVVFAPQRIVCYFFFQLCLKEKYTEEEGFSEWTAAFIKFVIFLKDFSQTVRVGVALLFMPIFFLVYLLEQLILHSALLLLVVPLVVFIRYKNVMLRRKKKTL